MSTSFSEWNPDGVRQPHPLEYQQMYALLANANHPTWLAPRLIAADQRQHQVLVVVRSGEFVGMASRGDGDALTIGDDDARRALEAALCCHSGPEPVTLYEPVAGRRLRSVYVAGAERLVTFFAGFAGVAEDLDPLAWPLQDENGYATLSFDMPGAGASEPIGADDDLLETLVAYHRELLERLSGPRAHTVVSHSMSATIEWAMRSHAAERSLPLPEAKSVILSPVVDFAGLAAILNCDRATRGLGPTLTGAVTVLPPDVTRWIAEAACRRMMFAHRPDEDVIAQFGTAWSTRRRSRASVRTLVSFARGLHTHALDPGVVDGARVKIVCGSKDRLVDTGRLASLFDDADPYARPVWTDSGHMLEDPGAILAAIRE